jgi:hypothetical protein
MRQACLPGDFPLGPPSPGARSSVSPTTASTISIMKVPYPTVVDVSYELTQGSSSGSPHTPRFRCNWPATASPDRSNCPPPGHPLRRSSRKVFHSNHPRPGPSCPGLPHLLAHRQNVYSFSSRFLTEFFCWGRFRTAIVFRWRGSSRCAHTNPSSPRLNRGCGSDVLSGLWWRPPRGWWPAPADRW